MHGLAWTMDTELQALNAELLDALIRLTAAAAGAKKSQIASPLTIERPYDRPKRTRRKATIADIAKVLEGALDIE